MVGQRRSRSRTDRIRPLEFLAGLIVIVIIGRLFSLQVLQHGFYKALAEGQHGLYEQLFPTRGRILMSDVGSSATYPLATNEPRKLVFANPSKLVESPETVARRLAGLLDLDEATIISRLQKPNDQYEPLQHGVERSLAERIAALKITGIEFADELVRFYPEGNEGSHVSGFLGYDETQRKGQYGIEGSFDQELRGQDGKIDAERDAAGRWIAIGGREIQPARDGDDIVLTLDRAIQHVACSKLDEAVAKHGADGGSVVVLDPKTGAVLAMCGNPNFDPNEYAAVDDASAYLNPVLYDAYEPGSVMKPMTMAAALEAGKVTPTSTYVDEGAVKIGSFTIRNSDGESHGQQTMTQVLEESLNTGAIYAMRQVGPRSFAESLEKFGFGAKTGIELQNEQSADTSALREGKEIYAATASYGQGITATTLQLASAFAAIANGGTLIQPSIVKEVRHADGTTTVTQPKTVRRVISQQTATTLSAMLVNVVRNGHGQRAGVPGYYIAGKTGTAQVARQDGPGYEPDITIGTFAGFGPVSDPKFVMVTRINRPRDVQFAESSAAPLFGSIANFILDRLNAPPDSALTTNGQ